MLLYLQPLNKAIGALAQLVEQRTENPCVPGSIPGGTTIKDPNICSGFLVFGSFITVFNSRKESFSSTACLQFNIKFIASE